jgi:predicted nuclease of predicted toxin-antitoxin system
MRVLLDECLPRGLKKHLRNHEVKTVPEAGWAGKKNGELLRVAAGDIDVFITIDSNLVYQQKVGVLPFGVVVLANRRLTKVLRRPLRAAAERHDARADVRVGG